jgi:hypothetical protein
MPEWLIDILKIAVGGVFGVGAGGYGIFKFLERRQELKQAGDVEVAKHTQEGNEAEFKRQREARAAEVQVLYDTIGRLEKEIQENKREFTEYREREDKDKSKLRSEHTACRLALAAVKQTREYLRKQNAQLCQEKAELNERLVKMEQEIELLKKGGS